jgi:CTP:molybdopterin cytidylyltransferase MocA
LNAVILGGGRADDPLALTQGVPSKGLVRIAGKAMGAHVHDALRASGLVDWVRYAGPCPAELADRVDEACPAGTSLLDTVERALEGLHGRTLIATADIPLLTAGAVRDLIECAPEAAFVYPIIRRADAEQLAPGARRTYVRIQRESYTGGNLALVDPAILSRRMPAIREVLEARKFPLRMALIVGLPVLAGLLLGTLRIARLEARVSSIIGAPARAYVTRHAEIGVDVDQPEHLELAERLLCARQGRSG